MVEFEAKRNAGAKFRQNRICHDYPFEHAAAAFRRIRPNK